MTEQERGKIRVAALKATKGPWEFGLGCNNDSVYSPGIRQRRGQANTDLVAICYRPEKIANANYIALTDPDTVIKLLDALDEAEKLKEFARHVIKTECWAVDGADIQDKAKELGLIEPHIITDIDDESDYEVGDTIYRFSQALTQKGDKPR